MKERANQIGQNFDAIFSVGLDESTRFYQNILKTYYNFSDHLMLSINFPREFKNKITSLLKKIKLKENEEDQVKLEKKFLSIIRNQAYQELLIEFFQDEIDYDKIRQIIEKKDQFNSFGEERNFLFRIFFTLACSCTATEQRDFFIVELLRQYSNSSQARLCEILVWVLNQQNLVSQTKKLMGIINNKIDDNFSLYQILKRSTTPDNPVIVFLVGNFSNQLNFNQDLLLEAVIKNDQDLIYLLTHPKIGRKKLEPNQECYFFLASANQVDEMNFLLNIDSGFNQYPTEAVFKIVITELAKPIPMLKCLLSPYPLWRPNFDTIPDIIKDSAHNAKMKETITNLFYLNEYFWRVIDELKRSNDKKSFAQIIFQSRILASENSKMRDIFFNKIDENYTRFGLNKTQANIFFEYFGPDNKAVIFQAVWEMLRAVSKDDYDAFNKLLYSTTILDVKWISEINEVMEIAKKSYEFFGFTAKNFFDAPIYRKKAKFVEAMLSAESIEITCYLREALFGLCDNDFKQYYAAIQKMAQLKEHSHHLRELITKRVSDLQRYPNFLAKHFKPTDHPIRCLSITREDLDKLLSCLIQAIIEFKDNSFEEFEKKLEEARLIAGDKLIIIRIYLMNVVAVWHNEGEFDYSCMLNIYLKENPWEPYVINGNDQNNYVCRIC